MRCLFMLQAKNINNYIFESFGLNLETPALVNSNPLLSELIERASKDNEEQLLSWSASTHIVDSSSVR